MKHKNLTKEQIIVSIDRLTRFKSTKEKYLRVFTDIILACLTEPRLKKNDIERISFADLTEIAQNILNSSIGGLCGFQKADLRINSILKDYENSVCFNDEETIKFLDNQINYSSAATLISGETPVNIKWLKEIAKSDGNLIMLRKEKALKYPVEKVILAEGITEEILLPAFSKYLGKDFYKRGIHIIAAGGKNQVVKMYYRLIEEIKLPIYILLDKDAEENINQIKPKLRKIDKIHLVSCGEFEDLLPKSLIVKTVNKHFENFLTVTEKDLESEYSTAKVLTELFRLKGLHEFKKADFAKLVRENINEDSDISSEIRDITDELNN